MAPRVGVWDSGSLVVTVPVDTILIVSVNFRTWRSYETSSSVEAVRFEGVPPRCESE